MTLQERQQQEIEMLKQQYNDCISLLKSMSISQVAEIRNKLLEAIESVTEYPEDYFKKLDHE